MAKQLWKLLSRVKSEPVIGVCMLPATKDPDATPQIIVVGFLSPFSGWLKKENGEVSLFQNLFFFF